MCFKLRRVGPPVGINYKLPLECLCKVYTGATGNWPWVKTIYVSDWIQKVNIIDSNYAIEVQLLCHSCSNFNEHFKVTLFEAWSLIETINCPVHTSLYVSGTNAELPEPPACKHIVLYLITFKHFVIWSQYCDDHYRISVACFWCEYRQIHASLWMMI